MISAIKSCLLKQKKRSTESVVPPTKDAVEQGKAVLVGCVSPIEVYLKGVK